MRRTSVSNIKLAAYLAASGHGVIGTDRNGRRVTFIFEATEDFEADVDLYRFGDPSLSVHDLFGALSRLKSLIFDSPVGGR